MTEARVSHFGRRLGHIVAAGAQQLCRVLHPQIAQILRNRKTDFARKDSAQVKRTAADLLSQHFQCRRVGQIAPQNLLNTFDALAGHAFLPHAKKLGIFRREKKMRHELKRLALVPKDLCRFRHRRFGQARHHAALLGCHQARGRDHAFILSTENDAADFRLEVGFVLHELRS